MKLRRIRLIGGTLLGVLALAVAASIYTLAHPQVPEWFALALLPGFLVNLALNGGHLHDLDASTPVILNIAVWSLLVGAPAIFCLTVDRE